MLNKVLEGVGEMLITVISYNSHTQKSQLLLIITVIFAELWVATYTGYCLTESSQKPYETSNCHKAIAIAPAAIWPPHVEP